MTTKLHFPESYPEVLEHLGQIIGAVFAEAGHEAADANRLAVVTVERIRSDFGGRQVYIPQGLAHDLSVRDSEIYSKFDGRNYDWLAGQYKLSEIQIRTIIQKGRALYLARHQQKLFE